MNQEQNNLNSNNLTTQSNKEIPNNQPIHNNQSFNSSNMYQQPINQLNDSMQILQPISPQIDNYNNQNNTNKPKNKNIGLIIAIILIFIIGITITIMLITKSNNNLSDNSNNSNTDDNQNGSIIEDENNDSTKEELRTALEYFDVSKFDKSKFNGILYNDDGQFNVTDLLAEKSSNTGSYRSVTVALDGSLRYAFANDYSNWRTMYSESHKQSSDDYVNALLETLGHPSTYCENYFDDANGKTGDFYLYYNYGNYVIFVLGHDFRGNEKYNFNYIGISQISISSSDDFEFVSYGTCYGEYASN